MNVSEIERKLGRRLKKAEQRILDFVASKPRTTGEVVDELDDNNPAYLAAALRLLEAKEILAYDASGWRIGRKRRRWRFVSAPITEEPPDGGAWVTMTRAEFNAIDDILYKYAPKRIGQEEDAVWAAREARQKEPVKW